MELPLLDPPSSSFCNGREGGIVDIHYFLIREGHCVAFLLPIGEYVVFLYECCLGGFVAFLTNHPFAGIWPKFYYL